jgi:hypothetical protein
MGDADRKDVTVNDKRTSDFSDLVGLFFDRIVDVHRLNLLDKEKLRREQLDIFYKLKSEYEVAQRSRIFFGNSTIMEVLDDSNSHALQQMKKISRELDESGDKQLDQFIKLAVEAPKDFLEAVMSVFIGAKNGTLPELTQGNNNALDVADILSAFGRQENNDPKPVRRKRKSFGKAFEEDL